MRSVKRCRMCSLVKPMAPNTWCAMAEPSVAASAQRILAEAASSSTASSNRARMRDGVGGGAGDRERGGGLAGKPRQVLLHGLEFPDVALEGDALVGIRDAEREDRLQRAGDLRAADRCAHQQQRAAVEARRERREPQRLDALERHRIGRLARQVAALADAAILRLDQRDGRPAAFDGEHRDVLGLLREGHAARAAAQGVVAY